MPSTEQTPLLAQQNPSTGVHHATPSRFVTYQAVSLLSAVDGVLGTFVYREWSAKTVTAATFGATLDYTDAFTSGLLLQGGGALAGAVCGIVFLIMMLHPSHAETKGTVLAKEITFCIVLLALLAALIYATMIFATTSATLYTTKLSHHEMKLLMSQLGSLRYKDSVIALLFVVLGWVMWLFLGISTILVSATGRHVLREGPVTDAPQNLPERLAFKYLAPIFSRLGFEVTPRA